MLRMMRKSKAEAEGLEIFSGLLLTSTLENSLAGLDDAALARFAHQAFQHVLQKPHKRHSIGFTASDLIPGEAQPSTVLEILNDDMPYVLESVISELHAQGLIPRLVFHPIFKVKRYGAGRLQAVVGPGDRHWGGGDQESYIAVLLDPIQPEQQAHLTHALGGVLDDVRIAAGDAEAMRTRLGQAIGAYEGIQLSLNAAPGAPAPLELKEAAEFLRWLGQGNFTLLGVREFELVGIDEKVDLWPSATGVLGIAKSEAPAAAKGGRESAMTPGMRHVFNGPSPLIFSKSSVQSRVRRRVPLDCIGLKRYTPTGKLLGETRLYGLFTSAAYVQPVETVPVMRQKVRRVLADAQFPPDSHNGRTLIDILENLPRDELLQIDQRRLHQWSMTLIDLSIRPRPCVLTRWDDIGRTCTALVFVPRDHYSSDVRERIGHYLEAQLGGHVVAFYPYITATPLVRTRMILDGGRGPGVSDETLERGVVEIIKTWEEKLESAMSRRPGAAGPRPLGAAFRGAFSAGYAEMFPVERAVEDIARIERLGPEAPIAIDFYREADAPAHRVRIALYRFDQPIALSERVPLLENMGFKVIDERSYRVRPKLGGMVRDVVLHDMVVETADGAPIDLPRHGARMEDAFLAVFNGDAESDLYNALVITAGLDYREAAVLRAYAAYMRQMRSPFSPRYIAETLIRYPLIARDLWELFRVRLGEADRAASDATAEIIRSRIETALGGVQGLDEDRILRRMLGVLLATLRTNVFTRDAQGRAPPAMAFKLASREIDRMPDPKPYREIFVYAPRVEGVHLRFAPIARGGIRWSDRAQDYRTEVLGLAKAQQVKNTVIVPSGAKGGFVPKQMKRDATREEVQAEGIACYRIFISTLLSLTDNIRDGAIVAPAGVVRRDGDDPYLVVAADKGTATFSDDANAIAMERGFWLGDAFASGGSAGYDHKRMGITARGAWECVKRHFREIDIDIQKQPFRVIGVGDMSGDVFGNAMLLSQQIRLVAAFDHRDIIIDPAPDIAAALAERTRLFALPRSSWADYDKAKISAGGGVFSRAAKAVMLTPQIRSLLGIDVAEITPAELIQAILRCETDLLWFGGIGTFVRETNETDEQAGDRANDALRVAASELRATVIGEGANLGLTQRARIEAAIRGSRLNTDFIDNSAGVNTSDQEVNIKIALAPAVASGRLSGDDRNRLLAAMSSDVATSVLANNHAQGLALSLAERASKKDLAPFVRLIRHLEERSLIERRLEALPPGAELAARAASGRGLTRPELAVLMSWAKIALSADLLASKVPDGPEAERLYAYFPGALRQGYRDDIAAHRLRREIVATDIVNTIVNAGGPDIMMRLAAEVAAETPVLGEAYLAARALCGIGPAWRQIDALDGKIAGALQLDLYQGLQELCAAQTVQLLQSRNGRTIPQMLAAFAPAAAEISGDVAALLPSARREAVEASARQLIERGVSADVAKRHAGLASIGQVMGLADRGATSGGASVRDTARALFAVSEHLGLDEVRARAAALTPSDDFERRAIVTLIGGIDKSTGAIAERMLADAASRSMSTQDWAANAPSVAAARPVVALALAEPGLSIARLAVVAEAVRAA